MSNKSSDRLAPALIVAVLFLTVLIVVGMPILTYYSGKFAGKCAANGGTVENHMCIKNNVVIDRW